MAMKHLDLATGNAFDDWHDIHECAAVHQSEILIKEVPRLNNQVSEKTLLEIIDSRMQAIKTPSCKKARNLQNEK